MNKFLYFLFSLLIVPSSLATLPIEINGYLNTGVTISTSEKLYLDRFGNEPEFFNETSAGLQLSANIDELWRTVLLFHSEYDLPDESFKTSLYMGYLEYRPNHQWNLKAGVLPVPVWLISDYYNVRALYPWFRPPPTVFLVNNAEEIAGFSVENYLEVSSGILRTQVLAGQSKRRNAKAPGLMTSGANAGKYMSQLAEFDSKIITLNADYTRDKWKFRGSYYFGLVDGSTISNVEDRTNPIAATTTSSKTYFNDIYYHMMSLGLSYRGDLFDFFGEYANSRVIFKSTGERFNNRRGYYSTLVLKLSDWRPHFTFGQYMEWLGPVTGFENVVESKDSFFTYSVGLNYNISPHIVAKSQAEVIDFIKNERSIHTHFNPGKLDKTTIGVFSFGLAVFF